VTKEPVQPDQVDWLSTVIAVTSAQIREHVEGLVLLITHFEEPSLTPDVPSLTELMQLETKKDLPAIFFFHGQEKKITKFGDTFDEYELTPDLLLMWSRLALLDTEVPALENYIDELEKNETVEFSLLEHWTKMLEQAVDEQKKLQTMYLETFEQVRTAAAEYKLKIKEDKKSVEEAAAKLRRQEEQDGVLISEDL
jgi:uncharacterized protein YgiM (DUF1202 family)